MKHLKIVAATVLLAVMVIGGSSFTSKNYHKAFTIVCKYVQHDGTYGNTPPGLGCDTGIFYCGFCYDNSQSGFTLANAEALAQANENVDDGTQVFDGSGHSVIVHKRSTQP